MRRRLSWCVVSAVAFAASFITGVPAATPTDVGVVRGATGSWLIDGHPLVVGRTVTAGANVRLDEHNADPNATYTILIYGAAPLVCNVHDARCSKGVSLPHQATATPLLKRLVYLVCSRFADASPKEADVRGTGEEALHEAVIAPQGTRIPLNAMSASVTPGSYVARLVPLDATGTPSGSPIVAPLTIVSDASIDAVLLPPGLYAVTLLASDGTRVVSDEAWVLVTDRAHYADRAAAFADAVKMTTAWPSDQREGARSFLHEALAVLASMPA